MKDRLKLPIWGGILLIAIVLAWLGGRGIGAVFSSARERSSPSTSLSIVPNAPPDINVALNWTDDDADTGRALEPYTRLTIQSAYLRAWLQWNLSYLKGAPYGLATYFQGTALDNVGASVMRAAADGLLVEQADTTHRLRLHLYSADGSIVGFTDEAVVVAQVIKGRDGAIRYAGETVASYDVVMNVNSGSWAVQQWKRASGQALDPATLVAAPKSGFVGTSGSGLTLNGVPFQVAGVNYYPKKTPWDEFWPNYDPAVIDADFSVVAGLGLNTVRIFVPYDQFGGPAPGTAQLDHLDDLLNRAGNHGLKVIVTLFDFRVDYRLLSWPDDDRHLIGIIPRFKDNPTILAWDIKNEPDLDYGSASANVDAWLAHEAGVIRSIDPSHLLTVGWSTGKAAANDPSIGDFISFHFYAPADQLPRQLQSVSAASAKPIVLTEFGLPTWNSPFFPGGHTDAEQAAYYSAVLQALRDSGVAGFASWTLYDFPSIPSILGARWPWESGPQANLGVFRIDGTPKTAARLLTPGAALAVPRVSPVARFFKPFWILFLVVATFSLSATLWLARRIGLHRGRRMVPPRP